MAEIKTPLVLEQIPGAEIEALDRVVIWDSSARTFKFITLGDLQEEFMGLISTLDADGGEHVVQPAFPMPVAAGKETPLGYAQLPSLSAATALSSIPAGATRAVLQAEGQNVRWRDDGTNPSSTTGMLIFAGQLVEYAGALASIKFIEVAGGAKLNVSYYK